MKRVAIYTRVSTDEQTTDPQKIELREYSQRRGWSNVREFTDKISGAKSSRIGLNMLMDEVRKHRVDVVLCVKLDRLGRSLAHLAQMFGEFKTHGCALIATSQGIDTSDENPAGEMMRGILAVISQFERSLIVERTKAGLIAARARGKRLGRPRFEMTPDREQIIVEHGAGRVAELAAKLGCSVGKAHALAKECST